MDPLTTLVSGEIGFLTEVLHYYAVCMAHAYTLVFAKLRGLLEIPVELDIRLTG